MQFRVVLQIFTGSPRGLNWRPNLFRESKSNRVGVKDSGATRLFVAPKDISVAVVWCCMCSCKSHHICSAILLSKDCRDFCVLFMMFWDEQKHWTTICSYNVFIVLIDKSNVFLYSFKAGVRGYFSALSMIVLYVENFQCQILFVLILLIMTMYIEIGYKYLQISVTESSLVFRYCVGRASGPSNEM